MTKNEALKMAIEALNDSLTRFSTFNEMQHDAIQACKDALEQPAWQGLTDNEICDLWTLSDKDLDGIDLGYTTQQHYFAALVEQALKAKNG